MPTFAAGEMITSQCFFAKKQQNAFTGLKKRRYPQVDEDMLYFVSETFAKQGRRNCQNPQK
ncbi:hypothetical protein I79_013925 [Cricetulus griseus]|uniref:Uncharacterized protein n=1 Tax=Cricetulus griseus TaxID=10029 RepID=G3HST1_CRIGR|nr:hypothetical protein I79_013925 [Cricetulus griseus]